MITYSTARWRLSNWRLRIATILVGILVAGNLIALIAYRSTEEQRPVLARQVEEADRMLEEMQVARDPEVLRKALADADGQLSAGKDVIPVSFKEADLLDAVVSSAEKSGVRIGSLQAGEASEEVIGSRPYLAQRYHVEARGDLPNLVRLLTRMEAALHASMVAENLILEPEGESWNCSFDLLAFARAEPGQQQSPGQ